MAEDSSGTSSQTISGMEFRDAGLPDWRLLVAALHARFDTPSYAAGLGLVAAIGAVADELDHHPDLDLRYGHLNVKLSSHDVGGVTQRDLRLATWISELAAEAGARPRPELTQVLELGLDTADWERIRPFWEAVLAGADDPRLPDEVHDPDGSLPTLWFQGTEPHDEPRQRFHIDLHVPGDLAPARIEAALAAGGTLISDEHAPGFTVLADPDGNKVCICTSWRD